MQLARSGVFPNAAGAGAPNPVAVLPPNGGGFIVGFCDAEGGVDGAPPPKENPPAAGAGVVGALAGEVVP